LQGKKKIEKKKDLVGKKDIEGHREGRVCSSP